MSSDHDISLVKHFTPPGPTKRLTPSAEKGVLVALTHALNNGYDGISVVWSRDGGGVYVKPIKEGPGERFT